MATACPSYVDQVGETAGLVWTYLDTHGPQTLTKLVRSVDAHRDLVLQAVGWLAREEKLWIDETGRTKTVRLR